MDLDTIDQLTLETDKLIEAFERLKKENAQLRRQQQQAKETLQRVVSYLRTIEKQQAEMT